MALALVLTLGLSGTAAAVTSSSTNYMVNETQFGIGGSQHDCSATYCAKTSAGDLVVGSGKSTTYSAQFGFNTTSDPMLEVLVVGGSQNMGVLNATTTGSLSAVIKVRNYLSQGYVLQMTGSGLSQGLHTLTNLASPTTSQQGAEQMGINFAANTTPSVGAAPVQVPSSAFSFGTVDAGYSGANLFKYVNGDIVGRSTKSSGETDYTMSMIVNVSNVTPGGQYTGSFSAVVTPIF